MTQRQELIKTFAHEVVGHLHHPAICGTQPFYLRDVGGVPQLDAYLGHRVAILKMDVGLDSERLAKALTSEKLVHMVPWDVPTVTMPIAYVEGRFVVVEAALPIALQHTEITLASCGQSPHDGTRFVAGQDQHGETITLHQRYLVHVLIGGTTGAGKSFTLRSIAYQMAQGGLKNRILLLDGKGGQGLAICNGLPGQQGPLAIQRADWVNALGWAIEETDRRYQAIVANGGRELDFSQPGAPPRIHIIADEFQTYTERAADPLITAQMNYLLVKGRAAGVHVWAGTHKPTVTMFGKAGNAARSQFGSTIGLKMATDTASRVLRGDDTLAYLLGRGDGRVVAPGAEGSYFDARVQMAYVPEDDIDRAAGGKLMLEHWPEFDASQFDPDGKAGRPAIEFSEEQIAIAIHGARQTRPWGRDLLRAALENSDCGIAGNVPLDRLKRMGRRIASHLDELATE